MSEAQVQTEEQDGANEAAQQAASEVSEQAEEQSSQKNGQANGAAEQGETIAIGADAEREEQKELAEQKPYWPKDWAEKAARHFAADDDKAYKRELKRIERIKDPAALYGMYRELDNRLNGGGLVKLPDEKATDEERAAFAKALGWTEKPEEIIDQIKLENDAVLGDADKPVLEDFAKSVHGATSATDFMNRAANWYFANQEQQAAALDENDEKARLENEKALKEEWGAAFTRKRNSISTVFQTAPGGTDVNNETALISRLMSGRMADGTIIGNDPDFIKWIVGVTEEVNPTATVIEDGQQTGVDIDTEIKDIEKFMRTNKREYFKDNAKQARYRELVAAREKIEARKSR